MATAILNGTITDDGGLPCEGRFEYGFTPAFGFVTPWRNNLRTRDSFREFIRNLPGGTTIFFQAQARNALGVTVGATLTFVTLTGNPVVASLPATQRATGSARLNGNIVEDMGAGCEARFEYGGTSAYGMKTPWVSGYVTGDNFFDDIVGLAPGQTYHYRAVARNRYGVGYGQDVSFSTLSDVGPRTGISMEMALLLKEEMK